MKILIGIIAICYLCACSEDFLERYPKTSLNELNFYKSETEYILLTNGCYTPMRDYTKNEHWVLAELPSDNASFQNNIVESGGIRSKGVSDLFMVTSDNTTIESFWNRAYQGITYCNKLLNEINRPGVNWINTSLKDRCSGEALFLRALYYFDLVRQFGGVPVVLTPITAKEAIEIKRTTEEQVYETIIHDLKESIIHFSNAKDVEENGRANWGAATSLLGKVYLTLHRYSEAEINFKAVIESNKYILLSDYTEIFNPSKKDFKETIFAVQYSENNATLSNQFIFLFAPHTSGGDVTKRPNVSIVSSGGWNQPTEDLINAFEIGDKRKDVSIKYWTGKDWDLELRSIPYCNKFKSPVSAPDNRCGDNFPIIRYSDVLLMYAETLNELGRTTEATSYVQQVRNRAGLTISPATSYTKATLAMLIEKERQVEFCFENQRWYDLKRTGKVIEVITAHGKREKEKKQWLREFFPSSYIVDSKKLVIPIPIKEIDINKLDQNPGY